MITIAGVVVGTAMFATLGATPLQPYSITRVDNNTIKVYTTKDTTVHLSDTKALEVIAYTDEEVVKQGDSKKSYDIKVKKGQTLYVDAQAGYSAEVYKIGNVTINIPVLNN